MKNKNKHNRHLAIQPAQLSLHHLCTSYAEDGVTDTEIVIGGVMDLEGRSSGLGLGMKTGIEAALQNQTVAGHKVRFLSRQ